MLHTFKITDKVYRVPLRVVIGRNTEVQAWLDRKGIETDFSVVSGALYTARMNEIPIDCILAIETNIGTTSSRFYSVVAHEVLHYCLHILDARGVGYCGGESEALCYFHTAIMEQLLDRVRRLRRRRR